MSTSTEEIAWAFRKTLEQAALDQPLVVGIRRYPVGEETFLDLIEHVALLSSARPSCCCAIARPDFAERRPTWPVTLRLEPLGDNDVDELIPYDVPSELRDKIARAAGGNPLFVEGMLAMVDEAAGDVAVPPTLQALLAARLDQLDRPSAACSSGLDRGCDLPPWCRPGARIRRGPRDGAPGCTGAQGADQAGQVADASARTASASGIS